MQFEAFVKSISGAQPPAVLNPYARSLWYDAKGDWGTAHTIIQDMDDATAARIHAYLHRKEGDSGNAGYWYKRAGQSMPKYTLSDEWKEIAKTVLPQGDEQSP
ncbi:MAG: hypothetical protein ABI813_15755 [Bacteroidota bacterium]